MSRRINGATILGMILVFVFVSRLIMPVFERSDIWWTPAEMALPPSECRDKVRVLIDGRPLEQHLEEGALFVASETGQKRVRADDVGFRVNNWQKRRADLLEMAVLHAAAVTAGLMLLVYGLFILPHSRARAAAQEAAAKSEDKQE